MSSASTPISVDLAAQLREARNTASLSQKELAALLEVSERTLQNWESGVRPRPKHRRRVLSFIAEQQAAAA